MFATRHVMMGPSLPVATLLLLMGWVALAAGSGARGGSAADSVQSFLHQQIGLNASDLREIDGRRAASRTLSTSDGREVATAGAVQLNVPAAFYIEQLRNIEDFKRSPSVLQIGTFGTPARLEDVAGLTLPRGDFESLRRCRPQDCNLQLSAEAIARFQQKVNWGAPDAATQADRVMRQVLVDMVNAYRARGSAALMAYEDRRRPSSPGDEFEAMVTDEPAILQRHPAFFRHVLHYPDAPAPGTTDLFYWSKEKVGPGEVISVTHMAFGHVAAPPVRFAVSSRQIYGSRYFDASLGLTLLLHDADMDENAALLVYVNRSRVHVLRGFFGGVKRTIVRTRTRSTMADYLEKARDMVERRFAERAAQSAHDRDGFENRDLTPPGVRGGAPAISR